MQTTVRATCPKCRSVLRIPALWVGQMVRCTKCRAVVRSKRRGMPAAVTMPATSAEQPARVSNAFDFAPNVPLPLDNDPLPLPEPMPQPVPVPVAAAQPYPAPSSYPYAVPPGYAYPAPPGYPTPVATYPSPVPAGYPQPNPYAAHVPMSVPQPEPFHTGFATGEEPVPVPTRGERSGEGKVKLAVLILGLLLVAGAGAFAVLRFDDIERWLGRTEQAAAPDSSSTPTGPGGSNPDPNPIEARGPFPRRLLFVHVSKYMFLNPLSYAQVRNGEVGPDNTRPAALRMAYHWHVPTDKDNNQVFVLSDTAAPDGAAKATDRPILMKNVLLGTFEQFFDTSREQDRIVIYFGGHVLEKDGKAYLAPAEGDLDDVATLIPLDEFYSKLGSCKATQKVMIWDVCRYNPERGRQRPGSEPMTQTLAAALSAAPAGVEVVMTCQAGENALEFNNPPDLSGGKGVARYGGSAFLESLRAVADKSRGGKPPAQPDPIPVAEWAPLVGKHLAELSTRAKDVSKQTLVVHGKPRETLAYNPDEPPARRFDPPAAPRGTSPAVVLAIEREFTVPPIKLDLKDGSLTEMPFLEAVMKDYINGDSVNPDFRRVTLNAIDEVRKLWTSVPGGPQFRNNFMAPVNDQLKREIKNEQDFWAVGIAKLELQNSALDQVAAMKADQPKRWQAHYEYARAMLKARLAYMHEYNKLMGDVLTESLPPLDAGQNAYALVSSERMKNKNEEVKQLVQEAQDAYSRLITEHKGTPWAVQAKRDKTFTLGLTWVPITKER